MTDTREPACDVAVVGGGPGGYAAAFAAADNGLSVVLVDAESSLGGVCLLRGCIPSKALLHAAKAIYEARAAQAFGVHFGAPRIEIDRLRAWKDEIIARMAGGLSELARRRTNLRILRARASFCDSNSLAIGPVAGAPPPESDRLCFRYAIIATGSFSIAPAALQLDDPRVMDSTGALELPDVPNRLLVVGGGYIGIELGQVYASLGSRVTVVEMTDTLLPGVDRDLLRPLQRQLEASFDAIMLSTRVARLQAEPAAIVATLENATGQSLHSFDRVLVSVGRKPNTAGLGLENTGVVLSERGYIRVNGRRQTDDPVIFAIGDVSGDPLLAHKATREGKIAADTIAGIPARSTAAGNELAAADAHGGQSESFEGTVVPAVVFSDPEIAWCGLTENEAKAKGRAVTVVRFPWAASGRALTVGRTDGLTKLVIEQETGRVVGVGIVGPGAGELIAEGVLAVQLRMAAADLARCIHPHPTLSETLGESAEAYLGRATHLYRPPR